MQLRLLGRVRSQRQGRFTEHQIQQACLQLPQLYRHPMLHHPRVGERRAQKAATRPPPCQRQARRNGMLQEGCLSRRPHSGHSGSSGLHSFAEWSNHQPRCDRDRYGRRDGDPGRAFFPSRRPYLSDCCTDMTAPCSKAAALALPERSFSTRQLGLLVSDCFHEGGFCACGYDARELPVSRGFCMQPDSILSSSSIGSWYAGVRTGLWNSWISAPWLSLPPDLPYTMAFVHGQVCLCHVHGLQQFLFLAVRCRACTWMMPLHSNWPFEQCHCSALKRRIGSSGSSASMRVSLKALQYHDDLCLSGLVWLGHLLHALCASYFALFLAILMKLLVMRFPGKHSPFGRLTRCLFQSPLIAECGVLSLGVTRCSQPVLPWLSHRRRCRRQRSAAGLLLRLARVLLPWCGVYSLPHTVWAAPLHSGAAGLGVYVPFDVLGSSVGHSPQPNEAPDTMPDTASGPIPTSQLICLHMEAVTHLIA